MRIPGSLSSFGFGTISAALSMLTGMAVMAKPPPVTLSAQACRLTARLPMPLSAICSSRRIVSCPSSQSELTKASSVQGVNICPGIALNSPMSMEE